MTAIGFSALYALALALGLLLAIEVGVRVGRREQAAGRTGAQGLTTIEGSVFALLGLLLAFVFHGATQRFDERRELIAEEANAVGTAWWRLDLLHASFRDPARQQLLDYLDTRIEIYHQVTDAARTATLERRASELQAALWRTARHGLADTGQPALTALVLDPLNTLFDIATTRRMSTLMHPPLVVYALLSIAALLSALLAGYGLGQAGHRAWLHTGVFIASVGLSVYAILDIEYPRQGLIRIDAADVVLLELRDSLRAAAAAQ